MSIIKRARRQKCVLWSRLGVTDEEGHPLYSPPIQIPCRWERVHKEMLRPNQTAIVTNHYVMPDRMLKPGDVLWEGTLADLLANNDPMPDNPMEIDQAQEVMMVGGTPNLKATEYLYEAWC